MAARGCPGRLWPRRIVWLVLIWATSVIGLAVVAALMRVLMELVGLTNQRIVGIPATSAFLADGYLLGRVTSGNRLQMTQGGYHCHSYCVRHRRSIPVAWSNCSLDRYRSKSDAWCPIEASSLQFCSPAVAKVRTTS
jgi:hypothetical protein